tara:strand:+ start:4065 stop:4241 length:177 start_codon:yes stop_codon:yes gene_type:complete
MKVKAKKRIPMFGSYKGLDPNDWAKLNNGKSVEMENIPEAAKEYVEAVGSKKSKKGEE